MIEQRVFEYLVNSLWQLPLLVLATWLVARITRPGLVAQHTLWLAALLLGVLLPLRGVDWKPVTTPARTAAMESSLVASEAVSLDQFPAAPAKQSDLLLTLATLRVHSVILESRTIQWLIDLYAVSVAFSLARHDPWMDCCPRFGCFGSATPAQHT